MRTRLLKGVGLALALTFLGAATVAPAAAWHSRVCSKDGWYGWRVTKWPSDADAGYRFGNLRGGILIRSILSVYPWNEYEYVCTAYLPVCDDRGHVIGQRPFLVC
jgi:hypothetical protein